MESAEAWSAEHLPPGRVRPATPAEAALWQAHLIRPEGAEFDSPLAWLDGMDLLSQRPACAPRAFVSLDHADARPPAFATNSTGLAAGFDNASTLTRALAEVAERSARATFHDMTVRERRDARIAVRGVVCRRVQWAAERVRRAGCALLAWDITGDPQVPCAAAAIAELTAGPFPMPVAMTSAAAPTIERALLKVIAECAQVRVTYLAGARDDLRRDYYPPDARTADQAALRLVLEGGGPDAGHAPGAGVQPPRSDAEWRDRLLGHFARGGAKAVIALDLGSPEVELAVQKVLVPGWPDAARL